jgi:hypothetical protein
VIEGLILPKVLLVGIKSSPELRHRARSAAEMRDPCLWQLSYQSIAMIGFFTQTDLMSAPLRHGFRILLAQFRNDESFGIDDEN